MTFSSSSEAVALPRSLPPAGAELGGDDVVVEAGAGLGVVKVEEADGRRLLPAVAVDGQRHAVGEVGVDRRVAREAGRVDVLEVEDDALRLVPGQPLVEAQQRRRQAAREQHLPLALALRREHLARGTYS